MVCRSLRKRMPDCCKCSSRRSCWAFLEAMVIPVVSLLLVFCIGLVLIAANYVHLKASKHDKKFASIKSSDGTRNRPWLEPCQPLLDKVEQLTASPKLRCRPRTSLVFLKTHRTGGSTIQNAILRFGDRRNLTFAFPPTGNYFWSSSDLPPELYPPNGRKFDLFCFHTVMDKSDLRKIMKPDAKWVTVMRDPRRVFESMYRYFSMDGPRFFNVSFEQFLENPPPPEGRHKSLLYGSNQISLDLGMSVHHFHIPNRVKYFLQQMESTFDFVMLAEKMDESMILLRHELCWNLTDVVSFHFNRRFNKNPADPLPTGLSEKQLKNLDLVTFADRTLYESFRGKFEVRLKRFGLERMNAEKEALTCVRERLMKVCRIRVLKANHIKPYGMFQPYGPAYGFIPDPDPAFKSSEEFEWLCKSMSYTEEKYIDLLREKQRLVKKYA